MVEIWEDGDAHYAGIRNISRPFVVWQLYFPKVFALNGGFDIVIGNPPYVQLQKTINDVTGLKLGDLYEHAGFNTFTRTGDLYCLFYEQGQKLLRQGGVLSFITSNKWMRAGYGEQLRKFFVQRTNPILIIDFGGTKVFDTATVDTNILLFTKGRYEQKTIANQFNAENLQSIGAYVSKNSIMTVFADAIWTILSPIEYSIKSKIERNGLPLSQWGISINRGILTGCNEAFIIDGTTKDMLIAQDPKSAEIIRPVLRGRDIKRYSCNFANFWLINSHNGVGGTDINRVKIEKYPAVKKWLDKFYAQLSRRTDKGDTPYNLRNCAYLKEFDKVKIVYPETTQGAYFYVDKSGFMLEKTCFFMVCKNPYYVAATLSSKLFEFAYKRCFSSIELGANGYQYNKHSLVRLPIIECDKVDAKTLRKIELLAEQIYSVADVTEKQRYINEIDSIMYQLYCISDEETEFIKNYKREFRVRDEGDEE